MQRRSIWRIKKRKELPCKMSDLFCSKCVSTLSGYLCAACTRMISEPRTPVKKNPLLHDINSLYPIRCYISWILKDLTSDRCNIWIVWTLHMNINLLQSIMCFCVHGDVLNVHCPKWLEMKHKTSKSPERAVFYMQVWVLSQPLPFQESWRHIKILLELLRISYLLQSSLTPSVRVYMCVCVWSLSRATVESVYPQ